jgi:hypothetical protein
MLPYAATISEFWFMTLPLGKREGRILEEYGLLAEPNKYSG